MSALDYPFPQVPAAGTLHEVAPGVRWISMPLPFQLDHINLWAIADEGGTTLVDTGIGIAETRAIWDRLLPQLEPVRPGAGAACLDEEGGPGAVLDHGRCRCRPLVRDTNDEACFSAVLEEPLHAVREERVLLQPAEHADELLP